MISVSITRLFFFKLRILSYFSVSLAVFSIFFVGRIYGISDDISAMLCKNNFKMNKSYPAKVDVFADALLLRADQYSTWGIVGKSEFDGANLHYTLNPRTVLFDWTWGFRTGIGYRFNHDLWDSQLRYTRFSTKGEDKGQGATVVSAYLGQWLTFGLSSAHQANIQWKILLNAIDWELGRNCYLKKGLFFRPHLGIKGAWINQTITTQWFAANSISATEDMKNKFWGIGPRVGINSKWWIFSIKSCLVNLFGDTALTFFSGNWSFKDKQQTSFGSTINGLNPRTHTGTFALEAIFGLGFNQKFNNKFGFSAKIGYEMQFWYNQLKIFTFMEGTLQSSLMLQGGMIDVRFDY